MQACRRSSILGTIHEEREGEPDWWHVEEACQWVPWVSRVAGRDFPPELWKQVVLCVREMNYHCCKNCGAFNRRFASRFYAPLRDECDECRCKRQLLPGDGVIFETPTCECPCPNHAERDYHRVRECLSCTCRVCEGTIARFKRVAPSCDWCSNPIPPNMCEECVLRCGMCRKLACVRHREGTSKCLHCGAQDPGFHPARAFQELMRRLRIGEFHETSSIWTSVRDYRVILSAKDVDTEEEAKTWAAVGGSEEEEEEGDWLPGKPFCVSIDVVAFFTPRLEEGFHVVLRVGVGSGGVVLDGSICLVTRGADSELKAPLFMPLENVKEFARAIGARLSHIRVGLVVKNFLRKIHATFLVQPMVRDRDYPVRILFEISKKTAWYELRVRPWKVKSREEVVRKLAEEAMEAEDFEGDRDRMLEKELEELGGR